MRFDIAFFLCCCRSFLSSNGRDDSESYYELLGVDPSASPEELKRAYKRQSLLMHPDKLAQKGQTVTATDRDRFTRMRHAYEVLSDSRRRETYDAIGERGMKWVEEPLSVDPQELAHNFATSSILDRSKIFAIFLAVYVIVFLLPIMVCLMADNTFGEAAKWVVVLIPLWLWDAFILFYHSRVIMMGPIKRPDHIAEEEWVDPLPMSKRVMAMFRFGLLVLFELLLALRLDKVIRVPWSVVFIPIYIWEAIALKKKIMLANMIIVTHEELELAIGKKFADCSAAEMEDIQHRFILVPTKVGCVYEAACKLRADANGDIFRILTRIIFTILLVLNLDLGLDWSWWIVFLPIWIMAFCIVGSAFKSFTDTQVEAARRDPETFMPSNGQNDVEKASMANEGVSSAPYAKMDESKKDGQPQSLNDEEREELKSKVMHSAYAAVGTCVGQSFFLFLMCLLIAKIEGAQYSYLVIISPFLIFGGIILCCLACTIFCITEVDENAGMVDFDSAVNQAAAATGYGSVNSVPDSRYAPPTQQQYHQSDMPFHNTNKLDTDQTCDMPESTWDPEKGQIWTDTPKTTEKTNAVTVTNDSVMPDFTNTVIENESTAVAPVSFDLD